MNEPRTTLITGGATGIGLATAHRLREDGWNLVLVGQHAPALTDAARELGAGPGDVRTVELDVTDEHRVAEAVADADETCGGIHAAVNSAGIAENAPLMTATPASFRRTVEVNLVGTFLVGQAVARVMARRGGGSIVNISSVSGFRGAEHRAAYASSKGGVIALTNAMAVELAPLGIRVNCVAPGPTNTALAAVVHSAHVRKAITDAVPLGRYGEPYEIAEVIAFLAGEGASYVTGQTWGVDGGQLASAGWRTAAAGESR